eukprot:1635397-Amphidinium_carterae.1
MATSVSTPEVSRPVHVVQCPVSGNEHIAGLAKGAGHQSRQRKWLAQQGAHCFDHELSISKHEESKMMRSKTAAFGA